MVKQCISLSTPIVTCILAYTIGTCVDCHICLCYDVKRNQHEWKHSDIVVVYIKLYIYIYIYISLRYDTNIENISKLDRTIGN